jgi:hypothetical protein
MRSQYPKYCSTRVVGPTSRSGVEYFLVAASCYVHEENPDDVPIETHDLGPPKGKTI